MKSKTKIAIILLFALEAPFAFPQSLPLSQRVADSAMQRWPEGRFTLSDSEMQWNYGFGILLQGLAAEWFGTANQNYYNYFERPVDALIAPDGSIANHDGVPHSAVSLALGRQLLLLYRVTQQEKYFKAAALLRAELVAHTHNQSGEFPSQIARANDAVLEEVFLALPFRAEFASISHGPREFRAITREFALIERRALNHRNSIDSQSRNESGMLMRLDHKLATTRATHARILAWNLMALVDALQYYPENDPGRATLLAILHRTAQIAARYEYGENGSRHGVVATPEERKSAFQAATACMFTYALAKGARHGFLPERYIALADRIYRAVLANFINAGSNGTVELTGDPGTTGDLLLASREMEIAPLAKSGRGNKVLLDAWFNSQQRRNAAGVIEYFHYKWEDYSNSGFSLFGHLFNDFGIETETLYQAPTASNLRTAQFYIIVSPDIPVKNPEPHYVTRKDAEKVADWVKQGGILLMMENDPDNADIDHLDVLADIFGLHFNKVLSHHVVGDTFSMGKIEVAGGGELFDRSQVLYMKDTCTLGLSEKATPLLVDKGDVMMATAKYGRGTVFAVVDPWLYNEYTDGRKLPPEYQNVQGAQALLRWLLRQLPSTAAKQAN